MHLGTEEPEGRTSFISAMAAITSGPSTMAANRRRTGPRATALSRSMQRRAGSTAARKRVCIRAGYGK